MDHVRAVPNLLECERVLMIKGLSRGCVNIWSKLYNMNRGNVLYRHKRVLEVIGSEYLHW